MYLKIQLPWRKSTTIKHCLPFNKYNQFENKMKENKLNLLSIQLLNMSFQHMTIYNSIELHRLESKLNLFHNSFY